jgi:hypothetical protein
MRRNVYAVFADVNSAQSALGALLDHGAAAEDVSLIVKEPYVSHYDGTEPNATEVKESAAHGLTTTTSGDAAVGAAKGAGIGLGVGALAALASMLVPGIGLVIGGGALATAIAGAAGTTAAGAVAGGLTGYLKDQGVSEEQATLYMDTFDNGAAIVSVSVPTGNVDAGTAEAIFGKYQNATTWTSETEKVPTSTPTY